VAGDFTQAMLDAHSGLEQKAEQFQSQLGLVEDDWKLAQVN